MKVYFDMNREVLVISSAKQSFSPKSLYATLEGNLITIWEADGQTKVLKSRYINIYDKDGNGFVTSQDCLMYLTGEFSKSATSNFNGGYF